MVSGTTDPRSGTDLFRVRLFIILFGLLAPHLARLPGTLTRGADWFYSYLPKDLGALLFFAGFNAIGWGAVLLATMGLSRARSAWFPITFGFAFPCAVHSQLDLASDAQAAIVLVFVPIYSLPLVLVGGVLGRWYDRRTRGSSGVP